MTFKTKLPKLWAYDPNGINQVGCVCTAQGFEFDYAGVIFGNDLTYNFDQQTWKGHLENSADNIAKRSKNNFTELIRNIYRVLLSSIFISFFIDALIISWSNPFLIG
jgi:uncharacterized protein